MRTLVFLVSLISSVALAQTPTAHLDAPSGKFFDDPIALSSGGSVALVSTDAATASTLHLWNPTAKTELKVDGLPAQVSSLFFLSEGKVLAVYAREDRRMIGAVANVQGTGDASKLVLDKTRFGPADAIAVARGSICVYSRKQTKSGAAQHELQLFSPSTLKSIARKTFFEDNEGLLRLRTGAVRPLWWSQAHTQLAAQKIGEYDKAKDVRRPDRYAVIDVPNDKVQDEQEIGDVLGFTKATMAHRAIPDLDAFARLSEDRKQILIEDGLFERALPIARPIALYEPASLQSIELDNKTLLVSLQVDANNSVAVAKRVRDADEVDLYTLDRASMRDKEPSSRRVLTLPGEGRPARIAAIAGRVAILRKGKGFDRGGVAVELYALP